MGLISSFLNFQFNHKQEMPNMSRLVTLLSFKAVELRRLKLLQQRLEIGKLKTQLC